MNYVVAASSVLIGAVDSHTLRREEASFFGRTPVSGFTLFGRNIPEDYTKTAELSVALQKLRPAGQPPLAICVDQEGGRVARLRGEFPGHGPPLGLLDGAVDQTSLGDLQKIGARVGTALSAVGFNVNFAPVLDILGTEVSDAIGDRAFGTEPATVTARAAAWLTGLQLAGVNGCLKHFPGQGRAEVDTHIGEAVVDLAQDDLESWDLAPFKDLIPITPLVMIAHCIYPALDQVRASQSPSIIRGLLRQTLGFKGVVVSDDLNMGALPQDNASWREALCDCLVAGCDMLLVCQHLDRQQMAVEALSTKAASSKAFAVALTAAAERVLQFRKTL